MTGFYLKGLSNTVKKFNNKEGGYFCLDDGNEKDFLTVDINEVVMRRAEYRRHVIRVPRLLPGFKEVIADRAAYHTFPVFFQEYVTSAVNQEQAMNHVVHCGNENSEDSIMVAVVFGCAGDAEELDV